MSIASVSPASRLSHGFVLAAISGRHCRTPRTSRDDALLRTITTRWSFEKPGTVADVATLSLHPMTPTAASLAEGRGVGSGGNREPRPGNPKATPRGERPSERHPFGSE